MILITRKIILTILLFFFFFLTVVSVSFAYNASDCLGQLDSSYDCVFTKGLAQNNSDGGNRGFDSLQKTIIDTTNNRLFVSDAGNNRVLVFNLDASNNLIDRVADFVIGQPNFTTKIADTTQNSLNNNAGLFYDSTNNRLFVSDAGNNRVLVFDTATINNGENAINVLGQTDFTSNTAAVTQSGMSSPGDIVFDSANNRLFVADQIVHRILVFDVTSITNGENAINVLGQANFTSSTVANTQAGLDNPSGISLDSTNNRLFVADTTNSRVIVYDVVSITDGENAIQVLGQTDFTTKTQRTTQAGLRLPRGVEFDSTNIFF